MPQVRQLRHKIRVTVFGSSFRTREKAQSRFSDSLPQLDNKRTQAAYESENFTLFIHLRTPGVRARPRSAAMTVFVRKDQTSYFTGGPLALTASART